MKLFLVFAFILTLPLCAQEKDSPWANPDNLKGAMFYLGNHLYTLKKPKKYVIPKEIQNMIMTAMAEVSAARALVLREEYEVIYQDKDALKEWVDDVLAEIEPIARLRKENATNASEIEAQVNIEISVDGWRYYNQTKW